METKEITATFNVPTAVIDNIVNEITSRVMTKMSDTLRTISDILVDEVSTVKSMVKTMVENKVAEAVQTVTGNEIPANDDVIESKVAEAVEDNETPEDKSDETPADEATDAPVDEAENQPKQAAFDYMAVQKYCEEFELEQNRPIAGFSKGMKRRTSILFALCTHPKLLLLDEAYDGLPLEEGNEYVGECVDLIGEKQPRILLKERHVGRDLPPVTLRRHEEVDEEYERHNPGEHAGKNFECP